MSEIDEIRKQMRSAQVFGKGRYFKDGVFDLEIDKFFYKRSVTDGAVSENYICEFKILTSTNSELVPGSTVSSVFAVKPNTGWMNRLKALLLAVVGVDPDASAIPPAAEEAATDLYVAMRDDNERKRLGLPENPCSGIHVHAEAISGKSRAGGPVTHMKWKPAPQVNAAA
jgi:hypothetical protein